MLLVVGEDPAIRAWIADGLRGAGYWAIVARDINEAAYVLKRHRIDLIVIDMLRAKKEGIEMLLFVRKQHPGLKVIAAMERDPANLRMARSLGVRAVLEEPFALDELAAVVDLVCRSGCWEVSGVDEDLPALPPTEQEDAASEPDDSRIEVLPPRANPGPDRIL